MAKRKQTNSTNSLVDKATQYAIDVTSGKILAGPDIRNSCKRHLDDLKNAKEKGLIWDTESADRATAFFEKVLKLNGGEHEGKPFILLPWQCFIVSSIFGWKTLDGYRRFRMVYIESGKGSGKSPLAAGIGLYCLMADNEPRAEVYAAATKKDQAMILFRDAVAMIDQSPALSERIRKSGTGQNVWNLAYLQKGAFFRPISSDNGQSGPRPHCVLIDEIHEHKSNEVVEMMRAGTKGRTQAIILMITNSGHNKTSVCYEYHEYGRKVAEQTLTDDAFFSFICSLDEGDDPLTDESCWPKANPSLGHTFTHKYLREQVTQAKGMPTKESIVRRLNFCQWVEADNPWLAADIWMANEQDFNIEEFVGEECYGGLDLSGTRDLTALSIYFPKYKTAFTEFWTPQETLLDRSKSDHVPYDVWVKQGHLFATPGRVVDYDYVAKRLGELKAKFNIIRLAFDPYRIKYFQKSLDNESIDIEMTPHGQGFFKSQESGLWMPHSIELLEKDITENNITIKFNPCLRWNAASAVLESDNKENKVFAKKKSSGRIDGVVSLAMARGCADATYEQTNNLSDHILNVGIRSL